MNALFRPGPLQYIPNFIKRKHGLEPIVYDLPEMEEMLEETYGITVYQEQVMRLSQKLAGFTKGQADTLRKAMGKKDRGTLDKLKPIFIEGCETNNLDVKICDKVWADWEKFASYAFNKSHSTCYAFVAYQTAYLKANYPTEYMASILTHSISSIDKITFFMEECHKMGIDVLGPDVNESDADFYTTKERQIRFGLSAIKGAGEVAIQQIIEERKQNGNFKDVYDLVERINLKSVNKRTMEGLALSGGLDSILGDNLHRKHFVDTENENEASFLEKLLKYGNAYQTAKDDALNNLFGAGGMSSFTQPKPATLLPFTNHEKLEKEKEVIGFFISGHPLDDYKIFIEGYFRNSIAKLNIQRDKETYLVGYLSETSKKGFLDTEWGLIKVEDYSGSMEFRLFKENYQRNKEMLQTGNLVLITLMGKKAWNNEKKIEETRPEVIKVEDLSFAVQHYPKEVNMVINLSDLSVKTRDKIKEVVKKYPGNKPVYFTVYQQDDEINHKLERKATPLKLNTSVEFLREVNQIDEFQVMIR
jgi:DNA polymerase-3 subunit alpha